MSRKEETPSSLDLLLDTICNMFGGIVFIALLVMILSQAAGRQFGKSNDAVCDSTTRMEAELAAGNLQQEAVRLKSALERIDGASPSPSESPDVLRSRLDALKSRIAQLELHVRERDSEIANAGNRIETLEVLLRRLTKDNEDLDREITDLQAQLAAARHAQKRTLRLPCLHEIRNKHAVFLAVKGGRFYAVKDVSRGPLRRRDYDRNDVDVQEQGKEHVVTLLAGAGQPIKKGAEREGKLKLALENLDPTTEFIDFAVYDDSFKEFNYVKQLFVGRGFEYNWGYFSGDNSITIVPATVVHGM